MGVPAKILAPLGGEPAIAYSLRSAARARVDAIVLVAGLHTESALGAIVAELKLQVRVDIVTGGERRQDSVRAGLTAALQLGGTLVAVHDGARPLAMPELFDAALDAAEATGAAIV